MFVGTLSSDLTEIHKGNEMEGGIFDEDVELDVVAYQFWLMMGDEAARRKYLMRVIAIHMQQAMKDTSLPREAWNFVFTFELQKRFELPPVMHFSA